MVKVNVGSSLRLSSNLRMSATTLLEQTKATGIALLPKRFQKATKQLATLGPASSNFEMIEKLFLSGEGFNDVSYIRYFRLSLYFSSILPFYPPPYLLTTILTIYLIKLIQGADIFRLNFSHGEHQQKADLVKIIRAIEAKYDHPIAILADLQGPKLRVGTFKDDAKVMLADGQKFTFDLKDIPGDINRVRMPHPEILNTLRAG